MLPNQRCTSFRVVGNASVKIVTDKTLGTIIAHEDRGTFA